MTDKNNDPWAGDPPFNPTSAEPVRGMAPFVNWLLNDPQMQAIRIEQAERDDLHATIVQTLTRHAGLPTYELADQIVDAIEGSR